MRRESACTGSRPRSRAHPRLARQPATAAPSRGRVRRGTARRCGSATLHGRLPHVRRHAPRPPVGRTGEGQREGVGATNSRRDSNPDHPKTAVPELVSTYSAVRNIGDRWMPEKWANKGRILGQGLKLIVNFFFNLKTAVTRFRRHDFGVVDVCEVVRFQRGRA